MIMPLKPHFGSPVVGEGFFPRTYPVNLTTNTLRDGGSVSLFGPRRTGKSSIMRESARLLAAEGYLPIEIDLQGRSGPAAFASNILSKIPKDLRASVFTSWARLGGLPPALTQIFTKGGDSALPTDAATEALFREYWEGLSDVVQAQALASDKRIIFFFDELPYFCEQQIARGAEPRAVDDFLATLRRWRQAGLSMAIAGSIGMRHVLRSHKLDPDHLNDLTPIPIQALSPAEALLMLERLALAAKLDWWTAVHGQAILDEAPDLLPSYLQAAFGAARPLDPHEPADVRAALRRNVRSQFETGFFDQFSKRLQRYGPEAPIAQALFSKVLDQGVVSREALIEQVQTGASKSPEQASEFLQSLVEDGFLAPSGEPGEYEFAFKMVETWWRRRK